MCKWLIVKWIYVFLSCKGIPKLLSLAIQLLIIGFDLWTYIYNLTFVKQTYKLHVIKKVTTSLFDSLGKQSYLINLNLYWMNLQYLIWQHRWITSFVILLKSFFSYFLLQTLTVNWFKPKVIVLHQFIHTLLTVISNQHTKPF